MGKKRTFTLNVVLIIYFIRLLLLGGGITSSSYRAKNSTEMARVEKSLNSDRECSDDKLLASTTTEDEEYYNYYPSIKRVDAFSPKSTNLSNNRRVQQNRQLLNSVENEFQPEQEREQILSNISELQKKLVDNQVELNNLEIKKQFHINEINKLEKSIQTLENRLNTLTPSSQNLTTFEQNLSQFQSNTDLFNTQNPITSNDVDSQSPRSLEVETIKFVDLQKESRRLNADYARTMRKYCKKPMPKKLMVVETDLQRLSIDNNNTRDKDGILISDKQNTEFSENSVSEGNSILLLFHSQEFLLNNNMNIDSIAKLKRPSWRQHNTDNITIDFIYDKRIAIEVKTPLVFDKGKKTESVQSMANRLIGKAIQQCQKASAADPNIKQGIILFDFRYLDSEQTQTFKKIVEEALPTMNTNIVIYYAFE